MLFDRSKDKYTVEEDEFLKIDRALCFAIQHIIHSDDESSMKEHKNRIVFLLGRRDAYTVFPSEPKELAAASMRLTSELINAINLAERVIYAPDYISSKIIALLMARDFFCTFPVEQTYPNRGPAPITPWEKLANEKGIAWYHSMNSRDWHLGRLDGFQIAYDIMGSIFDPNHIIHTQISSFERAEGANLE